MTRRGVSAVWSLLLLVSCQDQAEGDHYDELAALVRSLGTPEGGSPPPLPAPVPPRMVAVSGGAFSMGSRSGDPDEAPVHQVTVGGLWVSATEITQAQYASVTGSNPSLFTGADQPVDNVSWLDAVAYCNGLSKKLALKPAYTRLAGGSVEFDGGADGFRLPTEAEWEWLARGGPTGRSTPVGWTNETSGGTSHPVGRTQVDALGLSDLSGNLWEWCWDWYGPYSAEPQHQPRGPGSGTYRVGRGGTWALGSYAARAANRVELGTPGYHNPVAGFRVVRNRDEGGPR